MALYGFGYPVSFHGEMSMRYVQSVHQLMLARIRFGALGGVPLSIHWTWFPFVILLSVLDRGNFTSSWWRLTELLALFAIVLLHEIGHVLAAWWRLVAMRKIVMIPFGGFAIGAIPPRWGMRGFATCTKEGQERR